MNGSQLGFHTFEQYFLLSTMITFQAIWCLENILMVLVQQFEANSSDLCQTNVINRSSISSVAFDWITYDKLLNRVEDWNARSYRATYSYIANWYEDTWYCCISKSCNDFPNISTWRRAKFFILPVSNNGTHTHKYIHLNM